MHRRPTVDPRLIFRYSSSCSFTVSAMTNVCCRKVASMVSTSESSESDESNSKNFSHGVNSIYTHTDASIYYTARENHKKGTNRWRVIPGGDEGGALGGGRSQRRRRLGGGSSHRIRRGGAAAWHGRVWGGPAERFRPQIWPESRAGDGGRKGEKSAG